MCAFTSDFDRSRSGYSPDRLDAMVWAFSELMLKVEGGQITFGTYGSDGAGMNVYGSSPRRSLFPEGVQKSNPATL
jgi:hypothetical protein